MARVIKIEGEKSPNIGIHYTYTAILENNATDEDQKKVKWQLYKKDETGQWIIHPNSSERSGAKAGYKQDYGFGAIFASQELLLTAYNEKPVLHEPPGLVIKPAKAIITKIEYTDATGNTVDTPSYGQNLFIKIYTQGMIGKYVKYVVYDEAGGTTKELRKGQAKQVQRPDGVITPEDTFHIDMPMVSGQDMSTGEHHYTIKAWEVNNEANHYQQELKIKNQIVSPAPDRNTQTPHKTGTSEPPKKKEEEKDKKCLCSRKITKEELKAIAIHATQANIDKHYDGLVKAMEKFKINTCIRIVHFIAQVLEESGHLKYTQESGDADYLAKYKGWYGRGLIQLTKEDNYKAFENAINEDVTSTVENRDKLLKSPYASYSAAWFFSERAELNDDADNNDFINIVYSVNGGFNHYDDRLESLERGFETIYKNCKTSNDKKTIYIFRKSKVYNRMKACIAWGLWHDKNRTNKKDGCKNDDDEAISGYERFVTLHDANPPKKKFDKKGKEIPEKWYGLTRQNAEEHIKALKK